MRLRDQCLALNMRRECGPKGDAAWSFAIMLHGSMKLHEAAEYPALCVALLLDGIIRRRAKYEKHYCGITKLSATQCAECAVVC